MEWYPSLFLEFFHQLVFPCRHACSSETHGTIPTSLLVLWKTFYSPSFLSGPMETNCWRNSTSPQSSSHLRKSWRVRCAFPWCAVRKNGLQSFATRHMDQYLNFDSDNLARAKIGNFQCLRHRAEKVCIGNTWWMVIKHVRQVFKANG